MPNTNIPVTIAYGDGIGPEVMEATLFILQESGAPIHCEVIELGARMYERGHTSGVTSDGWESLMRTRTLLKGPMLPPPEHPRNKDFDIVLAKSLGLYARITPIRSFAPAVVSKHPNTKLVIIQDNEEGFTGSIEHRQSDDVYQAMRMCSQSGIDKLFHHGLRYAHLHEHSLVHCVLPNTLLPLSRQLMQTHFKHLAKDYDDLTPQITTLPEMAAMLLREPDEPEVILCDYTSGEVLTALAAESCQAATMTSSACIGEHYAMFEPLHGALPDEAEQESANPSGMIAAAIQMLEHLELPESATLIHNAWLKTLEDGKHPKAIFHPPISVEQVSTREFAEAIVANFGKSPRGLEAVQYLRQEKHKRPKNKKEEPIEKELLGVDFFIHHPSGDPNLVGDKVDQITADGTKLRMIANRGLKVWPNPVRDMTYTDLWICRFMAHNDKHQLTQDHIVHLLQNAQEAGLDVVKTENLYTFNGELGYTLALGE